MQKKRRKAYRNLIDALLNCNEGEEWELLQAHPELLDAHFIQMMQKVAEELEEKGDEEGADFLWDLSDALVSLSAYQGIIEQLLNCASDEEAWQILDANRDWVDAGLLHMVEAAAQIFSQEGDENNANWLEGLAIYLREALNLDTEVDLQSLSQEEIQTYFQFLMEIMQATAESRGDAQVIYPLLAENTDKLDGMLAEILLLWGTNTLREAEVDEAEYLAAVIVEFGNLIQQFPLGDKASNMEIAIKGYKVALNVRNREAFPEDWAMTQNNLGNAYLYRIWGERAKNIENAITALTAALTIYTREAFPQDWAMTQYNLGNAYRDRIRGERAENIENTIAAYTAALTVRTREAFPQDWAGTQNNLGLAYSTRIRGEKAENIEHAIAAHNDALTVISREALPYEWADTQDELGISYHERIRGL